MKKSEVLMLILFMACFWLFLSTPVPLREASIDRSPNSEDAEQVETPKSWRSLHKSVSGVITSAREKYLSILAQRATNPNPQPLIATKEIPCGFDTQAGVDDNGDGILSDDEVITHVIICDKDKDFNIKKPMDKTIIRTQGK